MVHADLSVHVSILPINEHSPIFRQTSYIFNISESVLLGVIQALDSDRGEMEMLFIPYKNPTQLSSITLPAKSSSCENWIESISRLSH